jgi:hypothetical protein
MFPLDYFPGVVAPGLPAAADVRAGVAVGSALGTLVVPVANQVQFGVPFESGGAQTGTFTSNGVLLYSLPVSAEGGTFQMIQGNAYDIGEAAALSWTDPGSWPDLSIATAIYFSCRDSSDTLRLSNFTCSVVPRSGSNPQRVVAKPTHAQTDAMSPGQYSFDLQAEFADGGPITLVQGTGTVSRPVRRT